MSLIANEIYEFGAFVLDPGERVLTRNGTPLSLTPKVFDTLLCLVRNAGRILTKDELLQEIWPETFVEEVNLAVNVSTLRKVLGDSAQQGRYIVTVPGRGYRFAAAVQKIHNENGNQPISIADNGSLSSLRMDLGTLERRCEEVGGQETIRTGLDLVRPLSVEPSRPWKLRVSLAIAFLLAAALASHFWFEQREQNALAAAAPSIAVLPFADLSASKDHEYFSDGLTEELTNDLAKVPGMRVVARSSAFQFKDRHEDLRSVGRKLGVANILEGSVRREGNRVRITAELIKVDDGFQLWSATYDRKMADVFNIQEEIARAATEALRVKLVGTSIGTVIPGARTPNSEAYQAYLQAQAFFGSGEDKGNMERALASADEAIKLDPDYAPAWALRSYVLDVMAAFNIVDTADGYTRARQDANRAIALDPRLATGYLALGWIQIMYDWDWDQAENSLKKAAELEPGNVEVLRFRSSLFRTLGRLDEAIEVYKQVIALDPLRARSYSSLGGQLYYAGRYDEATAMLQRALELNPQKEHDRMLRSQILLAQGRPQQALAEIEKETGEISKLFGEALVYHSLNRRRDSDVALQTLVTTRAHDAAFQIAEVYAFRGESDKALEWLDLAYRQRDNGLMFVKIDPLLNGLRHDPRFIDILRKMRLPA